MNVCSVPGCGRPRHRHHIVFRSQGGLDIEMNYVDLCVEHHELGKESPHKNRVVDLVYKTSLQEKYYELFDKEHYTVTEIAKLIGLSERKTRKAFLKVPNECGVYEKEDIIRKLMGGKLY